MSMRSKRRLTHLALATGLLGTAACGADETADRALAGSAGGAAVSGAVAGGAELSTAERAGLVFTREEEKLARDVYTQLLDRDRTFANIATSEQTHMDAVGGLLERYALPDPAEGKPAGAFTDSTLQELHDRLVREGRASVVAALQVGLEIEELDVRDIEQANAEVTHADIQRVYAQLTRGSRNHLRAFYARLSALGGTYTPQYLDGATFDAVATSSRETGP